MKKINKKGVSVMIGYILLVTAAIVMGTIAYQWIITYVPSEGLDCPSDVSLFVKEYSCGSDYLNLTLKNNGKFSIAGYFIHIANESDQTIATKDISPYIEWGGRKVGGAIIYLAQQTENSMDPNDEKESRFNLTDQGFNQINLIEITPVRYQTVDKKLKFVNCGNSKIKERVTCLLE